MEPPRDNLPAASEEQSAEPGEQLPLIELDTLLTRPPSWRKRLWQAALVLLVAALALAALHSALLSSPAPSDNAAVPQVAATLLSNINFGTLTVNGTRLDKPTPLTIRLPVKGTTVVTLNAPPFRPQTCRFTDLTAPLDDPNHCQLTYEDMPTPTTSGAPAGGFMVGIFVLPDDLPTAQQSQALAAMSQPLGAPQQTTVHPGEYVATSYRYEDQITSQRATVPLVARASFEPSQFPGMDGGPACGAGICPWGGFLSQATTLHARGWSLFFTEALRWQFSDAGGVQADVSMPSSDIVGLLLTENALGGWQVAQFDTILGSLRDTPCHTGIDMLKITLDSSDVMLLRDQGVEGCELRAQVNGVKVGRYLWRFGVLLAADALAHASQPGLPVAPAAEIAAVGG
ncbi:MAG TPA: hypothetical protein VH590_03345 [Ktedonobacterales bacterium]|jgi:hypothetical protein